MNPNNPIIFNPLATKHLNKFKKIINQILAYKFLHNKISSIRNLKAPEMNILVFQG